MRLLTNKIWLNNVLRLGGLTLLALALGLCLGSKQLHFYNLWNDPQSLDNTILWQIRLPRVLMAALVGLSLACSGTLFQGLLRNPLADPYILGISGGAALGSVLGIALQLSPLAHMLTAFCAALISGLFMFVLAKNKAALDRTHLLLIGVIFNAFCFAGILLFNSLANINEAYQVMLMLMGSIPANSFKEILPIAAVILSSFTLCILLAPQLNQLCFRVNEQSKTQQKTFLVFYILATLLVSVAVATSGLIGFVGLCVPHIARLLAGSDHRSLIPVSGLLGAAFLSLADSLARSALFSTGFATELPVGVITAFFGAPFFLWLLLKRKRVA